MEIRLRADFGDGTSLRPKIAALFRSVQNFIRLTVLLKAPALRRFRSVFANDRPPVPVITRPSAGSPGSRDKPSVCRIGYDQMTEYFAPRAHLGRGAHHNDHTHPFRPGDRRKVGSSRFLLTITTPDRFSYSTESKRFVDSRCALLTLCGIIFRKASPLTDFWNSARRPVNTFRFRTR